MFYTIVAFSIHLYIVINGSYIIEEFFFPFELLLYHILQQKQASNSQSDLSYTGENLWI